MKLFAFENNLKEVKKAETYFTVLTYMLEVVLILYSIFNYEGILSLDVGSVIMFSTLLMLSLIFHFIPILAGIHITLLEIKDVLKKRAYKDT